MFLSGSIVCVDSLPIVDLIAGYRLYSVHIYVSFSKGNKTTPILSIGNQTNSRKDARACINIFSSSYFPPLEWFVEWVHEVDVADKLDAR